MAERIAADLRLMVLPSEVRGSFHQETFHIGKERDQLVRIQACSVPGAGRNNPHNNEDTFTFFVDEQGCLKVGAFDGTTSLREIPRLHPRKGAHFASHFLRDQYEQDPVPESPYHTLVVLNDNLADAAVALGGRRSDVHSLPASTATIATFDADAKWFEHAHIGDSLLVAYAPDPQNTRGIRSELLTENRNLPFDRATEAQMMRLQEQEGGSIREVSQSETIRAALRKSFETKFNAPELAGCGVVNGDPRMEEYIDTRRIPIVPGMTVFLITDGGVPLGIDMTDLKGRMEFWELFQAGGVQAIIAEKRRREQSDPDFNKYPRMKDDDGTIVAIQFS